MKTKGKLKIGVRNMVRFILFYSELVPTIVIKNGKIVWKHRPHFAAF